VEFAEVVARRRMIRRYRADPVDAAVVQRVVATACRGPSAGFSQGQAFVVVTEPERRRRIAELCHEAQYVARGHAPWLSVAPVHVIPCVCQADYSARYAEPDKASSAGPAAWAVPFWWVDGGAALLLLLLAAVDAGLGAGVLDIADRDGLKALLAIPSDVEPLALVTLGYAADQQPPASPSRRPRRPLAEQLHWQQWSVGSQDKV
jgi:nitroreductase